MLGRNVKNRFGIRLLTIAMLCVMIPAGIICVQWIKNVQTMLREQQAEYTRARLAQADTALTLMDQTVTRLYQSLMTSEEVKAYSKVLDGAYLENEKAPYADIQRTAAYVSLKASVRDLLRTSQDSSDIINSIYYYDATKNVVITYPRIDSTIEKFFDLMWLQELNATSRSSTTLPVRTIYPTPTEAYQVISVIYKPIIRGAATTYIVFNLDAERLYKSYILNGQEDADDVTILTAGDGQVLLAGQAGELLDPKQAVALYQEYLPGERPLEDFLQEKEDFLQYKQGKLCAKRYISSQDRNLTLICNTEQLQRQISSSAAAVGLVMLCMAAIMIGMMFYVGRQAIYPAQAVLNHDSEKIEKMPLLLRGTEMENLSQWMQESRAAMRYHYWNWAILGRVPVQREGEMRYEPAVSERFLLAVLDVFNDEGLPKNRAAGELQMMHRSLRESFESLGLESVLMAENMLLIAMHCEPGDFNQRSGQLADWHQRVAQKMESASLLAIGGYCENMRDVKECWLRATMLLRYQRISGSRQMQYDRQVENYVSSVGLRMWEMSSQLSTNLRQEAWQEARLNLENLRAELKESMQQMDYLHIRHRMVYTLATVMEAFSKHCGAPEQFKDIPQDMYTRALNMDSVDAVMDICHTLINRMEETETVQEKQETNGYVQALLEMLKHDCGSNMNLSAAADKLGLSSVYLSKVFKRVTGVNYTQYLTDCRMERAKELLLADNAQVQEIAESLGYSQGHYFSKIFKQYTGLSPSEYMRKKRMEG